MSSTKRETKAITTRPDLGIWAALEEYASLNGVSVGEYAAQVLGRWFNDECPPVSELDERVRLAHEILKSEQKAGAA